MPEAAGFQNRNMIDRDQRDYVLQTAREQNIKFVRLWFTDILGTLKSVAKTMSEMEEVLEEGAGFFRMAKCMTARLYYQTEIGFKELNKQGRPAGFACKHEAHKQ